MSSKLVSNIATDARRALGDMFPDTTVGPVIVIGLVSGENLHCPMMITSEPIDAIIAGTDRAGRRALARRAREFADRIDVTA